MIPWPVPVTLLPGELLSSWLVRAAFAQGCDPLVLTGVVWPGWRVWTLDPDRGLTPERQRRLAQLSGLPEAELAGATLVDVASRITGAAPTSRATWPWILALGSRGRRRRGGTQACVECFQGDRRPYHRVSWRLAWHTGCLEHGTLLIDGCPECGAALAPHRHGAMVGGALHRCASCGADLRTGSPGEAPAASAAFQARADRAVQDGHGRYGEVAVPVVEWFDLCRHLLALLRRAALGLSAALSAWLAALGVETAAVPSPATGLALELLPVRERAALLAGVDTILNAGPQAAQLHATRLGLPASTLRLRDPGLPPVFEALLHGLPDPTITRRRTGASGLRPRSRTAVTRQFARLRRKLR